MIHRLFLAVALLAGLSLTAGQSARAEGWGNVKGQVVFAGAQLPAKKEINVTTNKAECLKNGPLFDQEWVINPKNKGVRYAFVWLAPEPGGEKLPINPKLKDLQKKKVVLDQPCCQFVPHAVALWQGQELEVKNSATIPHNVNVTGDPTKPANSFNILIPPGKEITKDNLKAQKRPLKVACNIHPWMSGWMMVFDNPYFAITDADGNFDIQGAPAGKWRLVVWQEGTGYLGGAKGRNGRPVTVEAGKTTDVGKLGLEP